MAFRYPFDIQSTLEPWRHELGRSFDDVVAHLSDRDRALEDFFVAISKGASGVGGTRYVFTGDNPGYNISPFGEPLGTAGTLSGISMADRDATLPAQATRWVIYPKASTLRFFDGTTDRVTFDRTTGLMTIAGGGASFGGDVAMNDHILSLRTAGDGNSVFYQSSTDTANIQGFNSVRMRTLINNHTFTLDNTGTLNLDGATLRQSGGGWIFGSGITVPGVIVGNAGTAGATLRSRSNGNNISFDWTTGTFQMWVDVTNVKNFTIPHPVDSARWLVHTTLEGPENTVFYRGEGRLEGGVVEVALPPYFEALCAEEGRSVQLTAIAESPKDEWCPVLHATYPRDGKFTVGLGSGVVVHDQRFWWEVKAVRKDVAPLRPEPLRSEVTVNGFGPYTWTSPKEAS